MVKKYGFILFFLLSASLLKSQYLHLDVLGGLNILTRDNTIFQEKPFQFLYAAPYSTRNQGFSGTNNSPYEQIRLAQIYGLNSDGQLSGSLGAAVSYSLKNDWHFSIGVEFYNQNTDVFYGFQNIAIQSGDSLSYINSDSYELEDNSINIQRWFNTYNINARYNIHLKSQIKPFVGIGYLYNIQIFSNYTSEIKSQEANDDPEYYNARVFQDRLYQEMAGESLNHFSQVFLGLSWYNYALKVSWYRSMGSDHYYLNSQSRLNVSLQYSLFSMPAFK